MLQKKVNMMNLEFNRIEFEELEDRFEMAAAGGKCERKCSSGESGSIEESEP